MQTMCKASSWLYYTLRCENVYTDMLKRVYSTDTVLDSFPVQFEFEGENAVDQGGVSRDMFSAFWEVCFGAF